jgi:hypothetical protein
MNSSTQSWSQIFLEKFITKSFCDRTLTTLPKGLCAIPSFGGVPRTVRTPTTAVYLSSACSLWLKPVACSADLSSSLFVPLSSLIGLPSPRLLCCRPIVKTLPDHPPEHILSESRADRELRQVKYLNNLIEQDHRFIKRRTRPGLGFFAFDTAQRTLSGYETMNMIRKGQAKGADKGDILAQVRFIDSLFGLAA